MTSSLTFMPSTSHTSPLTFRRYTTMSRPDLQQGLIIEYTPIHTSRTPPPNEPQPLHCDTKLPPLKEAETMDSRQPKPWLGLTNSTNTSVDKRRRLERMNLRSENRVFSRASNSQRTNSSCKRSDSATNDSQKSALTANSLEERLSEDRMRQMANFQTDKGDVPTEEKLEQKYNFEKCMNWIQALPSKFSGMHIAQERAPVTND